MYLLRNEIKLAQQHVEAGLFFLAVRAGTAFRNLFEGTNFQKNKNKIINKNSVSKIAHYLRPSR
jgi:hypothetical protein